MNELTEQVVVGVTLILECQSAIADVVQIFQPFKVRDSHTTGVDVQILFTVITHAILHLSTQHGDAENAGMENGDHEKYGGGKCGNGKRGTMKSTGVENAGMENAGPNRMGRNRGTGKRGTKFSRVEKAGPPSMERETDKYRCTVYN